MEEFFIVRFKENMVNAVDVIKSHLEGMTMLDINPNPSVKPVSEPSPSKVAVQPAPESVSKKGTIVILSPDALKLSRDLKAIQNDPDEDPSARMDASVQLRQMAAQILLAK